MTYYTITSGWYYFDPEANKILFEPYTQGKELPDPKQPPQKLRCSKCGNKQVTLKYFNGVVNIKECLIKRCIRCGFSEDIECGDYE